MSFNTHTQCHFTTLKNGLNNAVSWNPAAVNSVVIHLRANQQNTRVIYTFHLVWKDKIFNSQENVLLFVFSFNPQVHIQFLFSFFALSTNCASCYFPSDDKILYINKSLNHYFVQKLAFIKKNILLIVSSTNWIICSIF